MSGVCSAGQCQWCGCHFVKPTDVMYHRCAAMQRALGLGREVRCRCGAWRLDDESCAWCDIHADVCEALDAIDKYAADELGLDHSLHALVEHYRHALGVADEIPAGPPHRDAGTEAGRYLIRDGEVQYAWLVWGRQPGSGSKPLGCYATREVALAAEEMMRALPEAAEWEDIWTTPWPLATVPKVNFRMLRPTSRAQDA